MKTKVCSGCKKEKPLSDFCNKLSAKDGKNGRCKQCISDYKRANKDAISKARKEYRSRDIVRRRTNARNHGMTLEEYDDFFAVRNYQCEVCSISQKLSFDVLGTDLHIDHCHETGENKGLLCGLCNSASGMLKDDPDLAFKLWRYLERTRRKEG